VEKIYEYCVVYKYFAVRTPRVVHRPMVRGASTSVYSSPALDEKTKGGIGSSGLDSSSVASNFEISDGMVV